MPKQRDRKIDLDNALLDCMKGDIKKGQISTLEEALEDELGKDEPDDGRGKNTGWV